MSPKIGLGLGLVLTRSRSASSVPTEDGLAMVYAPTVGNGNLFVDDFERDDSANGVLGSDWTVVDGGDGSNPFRILDNALHASFPGSTTEHRSAYIARSGWESVAEGFIAVVIPDVTGDDGDPTIGPLWYWNGGNIDTDDNMTAYVQRRFRSGRDTWLQEISAGPTFTTISSDFNLGHSTGQHILQASFEAAAQTCVVSVWDSGPDYSDAHTQNGSDGSLSAGKMGVFFRITSSTGGSPVAAVDRVVAVKGDDSRYITITGVPAGYDAAVQSRGPEWGYAAESSGTILIPCSSSIFDDVNGYEAIDLRNGSGTVVATFNRSTNPAGTLFPGTSFEYTAP